MLKVRTCNPAYTSLLSTLSIGREYFKITHFAVRLPKFMYQYQS